MDTASIQFVLLGFAVAIVSNLSRSRAWRSTIVLLASFLFLGLLAQKATLLLPLAAFMLFGYLGLYLLQRGWRKAYVWIVLIAVFAYAWLKNYTLLPEGMFLHSPYFTLGLSYIFFRVLHLLIEAGHARENRSIGFWAYLLYTLNFTTFISGPIQTYDDFAREQFAETPIALGPRVIGLQLERIVRGFFKVNVLAVVLYSAHNDAYVAMTKQLSLHWAICAAIELIVSYTLFLYCNFSGYIDIIMGISRLLRLQLPENFDRPFAAASFLDFWSRWHITLSNWFKYYVYNPMLVALMRRVTSLKWEPFLGVFCFFITFFLVGIWHGRTSQFIVYGLLQGGGVSLNKLWQIEMARKLGRKNYKQLATRPLYIALARGLTFTWFSFTLFWLWASWKQIHTIFAALSPAAWLSTWLAVWLCATGVLALWEWLRSALLSVEFREVPVFTSRYALVIYASVLGFTAFIVTTILSQPAPDIVYKAF